MAAIAGIPERCCLNCHFCMEETLRTDGGRGEIDRMTQKRAEAIAEALAAAEPLVQQFWFYCDRQVYCNMPAQADGVAFLTQDRKETCFFYPRTEGMSTEGAIELERRQADRRDAQRDRQLTRRAFWVAFGALMVSILTAVATLAWQVWAHFHPLP